jgi:malonyl-CoA decarboxylase
MADRSRKGAEQSFGLMVNYLYDVAKIEANHEAYRTSGRIATSSSIKGLLKA